MTYVELPVLYYTRDNDKRIQLQLFNFDKIFRIAPTESGTTDLYLDRTTIINVQMPYTEIKDLLAMTPLILLEKSNDGAINNK